MKIATLKELLVHELEDIYDAEHQLVEALPKMAQAATDPDLRDAFESHLGETRGHIGRLELAFKALGETADRESCAGMKGLIAEGEKVMKHTEDAVRDAALIAAAQKVEHYEIAAYGTLVTWAETAGESAIVDLLEQNLEEEHAADEKLTVIAEGGVNADAEDEDAGEESSPAASPVAGR